MNDNNNTAIPAAAVFVSDNNKNNNAARVDLVIALVTAAVAENSTQYLGRIVPI